MDLISSTSCLATQESKHSFVKGAWGFTNLKSVDEAYLEIDKIAKRSKPNYTTHQIQSAILSLGNFRRTKLAHNCLLKGYAKWIQENVLPLNRPETQAQYLLWMQHLATTSGPYGQILSEEPGLAFLDSKHLSTADLTKKDFEELQQIYINKFGPDFYAIPLAKFLMKRYEGLSAEQRHALIPILHSFPVKMGDEQDKQWNRELAKALLAVSNIPDLINGLLEHEIESTSNYQALFRNSSIAIVCLNEYCRQIGSRWLTSILTAVFCRLHHKKYRNKNLDELSEIVRLRIKRTLPAGNVQSNVTTAQKDAMNLKRTDTIGVAIEKMPEELHKMLSLLASKSEAKFSQHLQNMYETTLYLRFICPCLLVPGELGLEIPSVVEAPPHKQLVDLAKMLQLKANGSYEAKKNNSETVKQTK